MEVMNKYESMLCDYYGVILVVKHQIFLNPPEVPSKYSTPYRAYFKQ